MTDPITATIPGLPGLHTICGIAFAGLLAWAAYSDASWLRIPNRASLAIAAIFPIYAMSAPGGFPWILAAVIAVALLVLGLIAFSHGFVGGGDVKLMSAAALWAGPERVLDFLFITALIGGALGILVLIWDRLPISGPAAFASGKLPYGVAIAAGAILAVVVPAV